MDPGGLVRRRRAARRLVVDEERRRVMDAATLAVAIARLTAIAEEMGAVLRRGAYSPNIKERADCSAALFTPSGDLLVQAEHIPVHLGAMPAAVRAAIDAMAARGHEWQAGDQVVLNDPFAGGTHLNDVTLVAPVLAAAGGSRRRSRHDARRLLGWVANRAHHADLGGATPGSMPPDATEIQQEGLRVPPVLLTPDVEAVFVASSRTPEERRGDLAAQAGANTVGAARLRDLAPRATDLDEIVAYGERRMRAALRALPDGVVEVDDVLDSVGARPDARTPSRIVLRVTLVDDTITFDFSASDGQRPGCVNAVEAVTVSAVAFALRCATDPTIPANGGALRPVRIVTRPGTVVAAVPPVAVGAGNVEVSQRVADVCLEALAQFAPERVGAGNQGTMNNVLIGGRDWVYYETIAGGQGGRPGRAGMSGVHTGMTNTLDTPVEAIERSYPMRVRRYALRAGSGGAGACAGGDGVVKEYELLVDATVSLITERRMSAPRGLDGGADGAVGENWRLPGGDESRAERVADKCTLDLRAGDVVRILTPGGAGLGPV
jgi:N-methylhydantoinase B/oxoprolinase/acetone carboxylase alpha subunit